MTKTRTITLRIDYGAVLSAIKEVFFNWKYSILAVLLSLSFFVIAALLPTVSMIKYAFLSDYLTIKDKFAVLTDAFAMFGIGYSVYQIIVIIIGVLLAGINFSMLVYLIKKRVNVAKTSGVGIVGIIIGSLGLGCGACGTFVLSSFIGVTGAAGLIGGLPLKGAEFGMISIVFMLISIQIIAQRIKAPMVCKR